MEFRNFNRKMLVFILLILILAFAFSWTVVNEFFHISVLISAGLISSVYLFYKHSLRIQREVLFFFKALENEDTSIHYGSTRKNSITEALQVQLNRVNNIFSEIKKQNDLREQHFQFILENLPCGVLNISESGFINYINKKGLEILGLPHLNHIHALEHQQPKLANILRNVDNNESREIRLENTGKSLNISIGVRAGFLNMGGETVKIVIVQDLSAEMEKKEIEDWIAIIRVLSHEIMNSLAPISSISETLKELWSQKGEIQEGVPSTVEQTIKGLNAIEEQSRGLTTFFESYRALSRIPDPDKRLVAVNQLFEKLETLVSYDYRKTGINISFNYTAGDIMLFADEQMISNILINLIRNSAQALENVVDPEITICSGSGNNGETILTVRDNGEGIPEDVSRDIFMPFFTTRARGSGVGLSYSKKVMNMHKARIEFESRPGHTLFRLIFPKVPDKQVH